MSSSEALLLRLLLDGDWTSLAVILPGYSGYDIEDAIIMNRAALDRGFGRHVLFFVVLPRLLHLGYKPGRFWMRVIMSI